MEMLLTNPMGVGVQDLIEGQHSAWRREVPADDWKHRDVRVVLQFDQRFPDPGVPTADNSVPLGCAIVVFVYYNWWASLKKGPLGLRQAFPGPEDVSPAGLWLPVEIISHLARLLSLTVRLWVNMIVSEMLYDFSGLDAGLYSFVGEDECIWVTCLGSFAPDRSYGFHIVHIFVAFLQAFVFTILPVIYVAGAVGKHTSFDSYRHYAAPV